MTDGLTIDGIINSIGGRDETIHVSVEHDGSQQISVCTNRAIAKELARARSSLVSLFHTDHYA